MLYPETQSNVQLSETVDQNPSSFIEVSVHELYPGMRIAKLDKSGVLFKFYGQPIPNRDVIIDLWRNGVRKVYIKAAKGYKPQIYDILPFDEENAVGEIDEQKVIEDLSAFLEERKTVHNEETKILLEDINKVEDIHMQASLAVNQVLEDLRAGDPLDVMGIRGYLSEIVMFSKKKPLLLANSIRLKYDCNYLCNHSVNVCMMSIAIATAMKLSFNKIIGVGFAAMLHDIGMIRVSENIIGKGNILEDDELSKIQRHPDHGHKLLKLWGTHLTEDVKNAVLQHHERIDGSGYPKQLKGDEISKYAQIIAVADVYDALTSKKKYREAHSHIAALKIIFDMAGKSLSKDIVKELFKISGLYPATTILELDTGERSIVFNMSPGQLKKPKVIIFTDSNGQNVTPFLHDLTTERKSVKKVLSADEAEVSPHNIITAFIAMNV